MRNHTSKNTAFNSLYWDFCSASSKILEGKVPDALSFQFPLLGFLLCIPQHGWKPFRSSLYFQFPLLGFLLCIQSVKLGRGVAESLLSIPFIGIFALHRLICLATSSRRLLSFNSLYWDFCSASAQMVRRGHHQQLLLSIPFIGIFALHRKRIV